MKVGISNFIFQSRYILLSAMLFFSIIIACYFATTKAEVPECRATLRVLNHEGDEELERVMMVSMIPIGWHRVVLLLNGYFIADETKYTLDRRITMSYRRNGEHFNFLVEKNIKQPRDSVNREDLEKRLPMQGLQYHMLIEQLDKDHFLFSTNSAPFFICTKAS
ncbi:hypothetical protein [Serratia nevei]|uniref:hypothetical protein n=1 Tax=Serratia nevei TaxID=2703794 RepID=UPI003FA76D1C